MSRPLPRKPLVTPDAWTGAELAASPERWIREWSDAELDELRGAVAAARASGADPLADGPDTFPLPTVCTVVDEVRKAVDHGAGVMLLRGLDRAGFDEADLRLVYAGLGAHLGRVITQTRAGDRLVEVRDRGVDYGRAAVRGHVGHDAIAPHCDSADVVGLLCIRPAHEGGQSFVASATTVFNRMLEQRPDFAKTLAKGFHINLAGKGATGRPEECSRARIPVFSWFGGRLSCRFNAKQIADAARLLGKPLGPLERAAIDFVADTAMREDVRLDMDFRPGDIQLLGNHAVLHARAAFTDPPGESGRLLMRLWVNTPGSRPLAPEFADRLNSGPRGEVTVQRAASA